MISRRSFTALAAASFMRGAGKRCPIGLELYSVRHELEKDLEGTVRSVARMGYETVEFYSPYYSWAADKAKEIRKLLDDLKITCTSTHNDAKAFAADGVQK